MGFIARAVGALFLSGLAAAPSLAAAPQSTTATLTFDGAICATATGACADYDRISQDYGDSDLVDVIYDRDTRAGNPWGGSAASLSYWGSGYDGLTGVAWGDDWTRGGTTMILFMPRANESITINGFDLAGYAGSFDTSFSIIDGIGTLLYASGPLSIGSRQHFDIGLSAYNGIGILWGPNSYDVAIDNISYTTTAVATAGRAAPVPEPASWALMIGGIGAMGAAMRRRHARATGLGFAPATA